MGNQDEVQKNFGRHAANYRNSITHGNPADLARMIRLINPQPTYSALDVATGGGHTAVALAKHVGQVTAIDITEEMLAEAAIHAREAGVGNIDFVRVDVHRLPFADEHFDLVASRLAPHHFHDIRMALREMCRVLKPGGSFYIYDCSCCDSDEAEQEMNRIELMRDSSHICSYSPRQWQMFLQDLPLDIRCLELHKDRYLIPQWFERMQTPPAVQQAIYEALQNLSPACKELYPFGDDFITTYKFELLAVRK